MKKIQWCPCWLAIYCLFNSYFLKAGTSDMNLLSLLSASPSLSVTSSIFSPS